MSLNSTFSVVGRINLFNTHLQQNIERVQARQWLLVGDLRAQVLLHALHEQRELGALWVVGADAAECVHDMRVREHLHNLGLHPERIQGLEFLLDKNALRYGHLPNLCRRAVVDDVVEFHVQGRDRR